VGTELISVVEGFDFFLGAIVLGICSEGAGLGSRFLGVETEAEVGCETEG
jgi:hypothetical protein